MKRTNHSTPSSFGRELTVRLIPTVARVLYSHMRQDRHNEQMAFGLANRAKTAEGTLLLVDELLLPNKSDLSEQSAVAVCPTQEFQAFVYWRAFESRKAIVEYHSHPGGGRPHFSGTDDSYSRRNAEYIQRKMPEAVTLALIVGNNRFDSFNGVAYDRHSGGFRPVDRLEVLGRPSEVTIVHEPIDSESVGPPVHDRQRLIPGWNQPALEQQRIAVCGAGGDGAPLIQTLASIGAGRRGWIAAFDSDLVEDTNQPRLPYAFLEHTGTPKVSVAAQYVGRKSPSTPFFPYPCRIAEKTAQDRIKASIVIFGCGDNDGMRKEANELAVRYAIPYIDLGCDIQTEGDTVTAGGQVRVVLPGENACLVCSGGFDASQAAIDQMDDAGRTRRAAHGYVQNSNELATPSVANLNVLMAQFAIAQFLALVNGEQFGCWDYLHFDQFTGRTITATTKNRPECPACGKEGRLAAGDPPACDNLPRTPRRRLIPAFP